MIRVKYRCLATLAAAAVMLGTATNAGAQTGSLDAELKKLADEFSQAWAKGDAKAIAALHTQDAIRAPGMGPAVIGRAAIEKNFAEGLSGPWKGSKLTITPGESRQVTTDVYVGEGHFQITGGSAPAGAPSSGQYVNTFVRQGGRWLVASSAIIYPPAKP